MSSKLDINSLSARVGLEVAFVRRAIKAAGGLLTPYMSRGDSNSILFDPSAIQIFDYISQLKQQSLTLPEIISRLQSSMPNRAKEDAKPSETPLQSLQSGEGSEPAGNPIIERLLDENREIMEKLLAEKESHRRTTEEGSRKLSETEGKLFALQSALKMLPEGKSPEQIKAEWEEGTRRKIEVAKTLAELKGLGTFQFRRRKALLARLEELTGEGSEPAVSGSAS